MPGGKKGGNPNQGKQGGNNKKEGGEKSDFKFDFGGKAPQLSKEATAALMPVLQQKLDNLVGKSSGYLETLPQSVQKRVVALKNIQSKHDDLEAQFKKEREALEKKYDDLKNPLYARRSEIVKGESEPTEAELVKKEGEAEAPKTEAKADDIKGIPEFWSTVLKHNDDFNQMIEPEDEEALKHLTEIKCSSGNNNDIAPSFTLEFHFTPNAYFEETLLKKTYHLIEDPTYGDIMFDNVESTEITWKAGKNLTVKKVTKKEGGGRGGKRGGRAGPPKTITVEEPCNSFFRFFSLIPDEAEVEDEDELQDILESDYELGLTIKTQVIPNAVMFFTGEMNEGMEEGEFDEEDDEDEDDDEEGPDGDDDDEDDDEEVDPSSAQATAGNGQAQPECKQQ